MTKLIQASIAAIISLSFSNAAMAACSDPLGPKVDWSGCDKNHAYLTSADLTGADLTGANLYAANLYNADLGGADLRRADLTYANLMDAYLYGADMTDAIWTDGRLCAANSIGVCK
ncbi:pentapeptide repeat protein [Hoeflea sp. IMCC20628]|uniref:pentapeptide repeat-containing protein n=1 Tax=Hoeflea sp. IMCC20628 TaxID=1620421 RepID=UPI00063BDCF6|nr:pentapeptide repeat-containing protein [Hoeflea sp. IMCC20628]AKI02241.1 pentapeptide repeat protein [Hoeflea sp. IMCC20628]